MKKVYSFRQSDLSSGEHCLEKLRRKYQTPTPQVCTSDQVRGNVSHAAFEAAGKMMLGGHEPTLDDVYGAAQWSQKFWFPQVDEWRQPQERCEASIQANVEGWFWDVLPRLNPTGVEVFFDHVLYETDTVEVRLKGTRDWDDAELGLIDWKCPGRKPTEWELKRWDIQSTVYTWALAQETGEWGAQDFHRVAIVEGETHWLTLRRGPQDWAALEDKVRGLVELLEADLSVWPVSWSGWWCSPKWCEFWDDCRGKHLGANPW